MNKRIRVVVCGALLVAFAAVSIHAFGPKKLHTGGLDIQQIRSSVAKNDPSAEYQLGLAYRDGSSGVTRDLAAASLLLKKAADKNFPEAQNALAAMYEEGKGVRQDYGSAFELFENLTGSAFNDTLTGDGNANVLEGLGGNDTLNGAGGVDTLTYANATAAITVNLATTTAQNTVGAGTDTITSLENLTGSAFNDTLTGDGNANVIEGLAGNDTMNGAGGIDTLSYEHATAAVTVNLATTTGQNTVGAGTDTISGFENLTGSAFNDTLTGDGNANTIEGLAGNDTMNGAGGIDTLSYEHAASAVTVDLSLTTAQNTVGAGTDTASNFEWLLGSAYNDTLTGNTGDNDIKGLDGNDAINGGSGNDILHGGAGTDTLTGGIGADTFAFEAASAFSNVDTITDFSAANGDKIDIRDVLDMSFHAGCAFTSLVAVCCSRSIFGKSSGLNFVLSGSISICCSTEQEGAATIPWFP